jgi:hypothetical protein
LKPVKLEKPPGLLPADPLWAVGFGGSDEAAGGGGRAGSEWCGCGVEEPDLGCELFRPGGAGYDMMNGMRLRAV